MFGFARAVIAPLSLTAGVLVCGTAIAANAAQPTANVAVGPQYDSTHVYVAPADLDAFVASFIATFGGHASKAVVSTVTPTASSTQFQYIMSPVGTLSTFAYPTLIPYPFGLERTGYLVTDMNQAIAAARSAGASILVEPFKDPIGMDAVVEWPGGVKMQVIADDRHADGAELGRPGQAYRRVRVESKFGKMQIMATDGHLPYPFGHDVSGYEVRDLNETLARQGLTARPC
jgi:hypothetical protein